MHAYFGICFVLIGDFTCMRTLGCAAEAMLPILQLKPAIKRLPHNPVSEKVCFCILSSCKCSANSRNCLL